MISSLIRNRKQNVRIYRRAVYAGASFFPFFFSFFNCYSPHRDTDNIFSSVRAIRYLAYGAAALFLFFLFSPSRELLQLESGAVVFYARAARAIIPRSDSCENGDLFGESTRARIYFHNAAFPSTARVSIYSIARYYCRCSVQLFLATAQRNSLRILNADE